MSKRVGDEAAFPYEYAQERGLTIREYFAAMALQGILAGVDITTFGTATGAFSQSAVEYADAIIEALNKKEVGA